MKYKDLDGWGDKLLFWIVVLAVCLAVLYVAELLGGRNQYAWGRVVDKHAVTKTTYDEDEYPWTYTDYFVIVANDNGTFKVSTTEGTFERSMMGDDVQVGTRYGWLTGMRMSTWIKERP